MKLSIPTKIEKLWDVWELRGCIILSLLLQAFLVSFAPFRRHSRNPFLFFFIWSAYLLADWVAAVGIGLIVKAQTDLCEPNANGDLFAFWASFLLLHLGGPDSITSFAVEDHELWLRHLLGLVLQVLGAAHSIYLTLPNNKLWLPTLLVFVVGTIKYGERTYALYLASSECFGAALLPESEPGPDYVEEAAKAAATSTNSDGHVHQGPDYEEAAAAATTDNNLIRPQATSARSDGHVNQGSTSEDSDGIKLLPVAYELYEKFKGLFVGLVVSHECRASSRNTLLNLTDGHIRAFRIAEYELSFLYENLHTKVVMACGRIGYMIRFISFSFILISSILFFFTDEKHRFEKFDTGVTYTLIFGAVVLDFISFVQLISSDWNRTLVALKEDSWIRRYFRSIIVPKRRWCGSVSQYDIISYCLDEPPMWVYKLADYFHAREIVDKIRIGFFSSTEKVGEDVKAFVFEQIKSEDYVSTTESQKEKSEFYSDGMFDSTAIHTLGDTYHPSRRMSAQIVAKFGILQSNMARDLLSNHLAIAIYCPKANKSGSINTKSGDHPGTMVDAIEHDDQLIRGEKKKTWKFFSDYWFYLIIIRQRMVSEIWDYSNLGEIFRDTCDEIKRFCKENKISSHSEMKQKISGSSFDELQDAFGKARRDNSKSVFHEACMTVKALLSRNERVQIRESPFPFLLFASMACRPTLHAQQLSQGGELFLTTIWLLAQQLDKIK